VTDPTRPPHDVDALARRLPRRELPPDRSRAMRGALVDAAAPVAKRHSWPPRWTLASAAIAVATTAAAAILVLRGEPSPSSGPGSGAGERRSPAVTAESAPVPHAPTSAPAGALAPTAAPAGESPTSSAMPAGSPPRARIATSTGTAAVSPPRPRIATSTGAPAAAPTASAASPRVPATTSTAAPAAEPGVPIDPPTAPESPAHAPASTASITASAAPAGSTSRLPVEAAVAAERAFRDGLQALLAGDARAARDPLDRACAAPSSSREDSCYWAAIAWLRTGDRGRARRGFTDLLAHWPGATHAGEANVALGWLLLDGGDRAGARARFTAAIRDPMPAVRTEAQRGLAAAQ
jgi:TolA-binding protein